MSRFANPKATTRLDIGPCACPGTPHENDWLELRTELGAQEFIKLQAGTSIDQLEVIVVGWNLLDDDGSPAPTDRDHIERLYADVFASLNGWVETNLKVVALPNGPAASSRNTSRAGGSLPTPLRKKAG